MDVEEDDIESPDCLNNNRQPSTSVIRNSRDTAHNNSNVNSNSNNNNNNEDDNNSTSSSILDLDTINENGIIRLDMSKIIDKTGLPTYEAALKLESSGYV